MLTEIVLLWVLHNMNNAPVWTYVCVVLVIIVKLARIVRDFSK